jgi:hypothetical protein
MANGAEIRAVLDELDAMTEAMWKRHEAWEAAHPGRYRPLVCEGAGLIGRCTDTSVWLAERLGAQVHGYHHEDNPTAVVGEVEGGHDFVVVDDRWLVDWWAKDTYQMRDLYDMKSQVDMEEVLKLYGDPGKWIRMSPSDFLNYKKYVRGLREGE